MQPDFHFFQSIHDQFYSISLALIVANNIQLLIFGNLACSLSLVYATIQASLWDTQLSGNKWLGFF